MNMSEQNGNEKKENENEKDKKDFITKEAMLNSMTAAYQNLYGLIELCRLEDYKDKFNAIDRLEESYMWLSKAIQMIQAPDGKDGEN